MGGRESCGKTEDSEGEKTEDSDGEGEEEGEGEEGEGEDSIWLDDSSDDLKNSGVVGEAEWSRREDLEANSTGWRVGTDGSELTSGEGLAFWLRLLAHTL